MDDLSLEIDEPPKTMICNCCGQPFKGITGIVYDNGDAVAIYHAAMYDRHGDEQDRIAALAIGVGKWSEKVEPSERSAITLLIRPTETQL